MLSKGRLFILIMVLVPGLLSAQDTTRGFTVTSVPPGAEVILKGGLTVGGITPTSFLQPLEGQYRVEIRKYGYEKFKTEVFLRADQPMNLDVTLKPKTRLKALYRSLIIPGWGQAYSEQRTKGMIFMVTSGLTLAALIVANDDFKDQDGTYRKIERRYNALDDENEKERLFPALEDARRRAEDAKDLRRVAAGLVAAVWSLNILDVIFQFPSDMGYLSTKSVSITPDLENGGVTVSWSHRF